MTPRLRTGRCGSSAATASETMVTEPAATRAPRRISASRCRMRQRYSLCSGLQDDRFGGRVGEEPGELLRGEAFTPRRRGGCDDAVERFRLPQSLDRVRQRAPLLDPGVDGDAGAERCVL